MTKPISSKTLITIPVYNGEDFIARTLDSCVNQTWPSAIWVVDNQSTDKTLTMVKQYQKKYSQIRLIKNAENLGRVGNWNRCLDLFMESSYQYLHFVFAGDELLPSCNEETEKALIKHPKVGALAFPYQFVHKDGSVTLSEHKNMGDKLFTAKEITKINLGYGGFLGAILCNVYTKHAIQDTRFNPHFIGKADFDLEVLSKSKAYHLDKVLARFNLDAHRTFDKAISSWGFLEFTYIESKMLETLKAMFDDTEYEDLKERIILNGIRHQLQFFNFAFTLKIIRLLIVYWLKKNMIKYSYFFKHYWQKWSSL